MSDNLDSNIIDNNQFNMNNEDPDYKDLITILKEIKLTITLLEKVKFK